MIRGHVPRDRIADCNHFIRSFPDLAGKDQLRNGHRPPSQILKSRRPDRDRWIYRFELQVRLETSGADLAAPLRTRIPGSALGSRPRVALSSGRVVKKNITDG